MRKISTITIQFLLFFALFSLLLNSLYLIVIMRTDWDFRKRIESLKFTNPEFDLLILGSSLAQYGIDSELMTDKGLNSYNMALVGNSIKTCQIQLQEYLERYTIRPKYVILAANTFLEEFDQNGIHPVVEFTMHQQKIDLNDIPISKFRWQGTELLKKAFSAEYRSGYLSSGQLRRSKIVADETENNYMQLDVDKYESAEWVRKIANICEKENIELILIEIPGVNETQNSSQIGPYKLSFQDKSTATLYNLNSIEFCKFIDPEKDWVGLSHFNTTGAAKFTMKMLNTIPFNVSQ